jgi:biopolymer transport protein ExbD
MRFKTRLKSSFSLIDLTPLVDVIFLLLIFFVFTSDILPLKSLKIETPTLSQDAPPLTTQLLIVVDAQDVIYVGSKKAISDLVSLKEMVQQELDKGATSHPGHHPSLVLSVDRRVEYGTFLKLFSLLQEFNLPIRLSFTPESNIAEAP